MSYFRELYRLPVKDWQREMLDHLHAEELAAICELLGIPVSGTKAERSARIWQARHLRLVLAPYTLGQAGVAQLAKSYRADELLALCRAAGAYAGATKYARAASLIQWREACRQRGQEALDQARAAVAGQPGQKRLL
ncbi:hypothetical protein EKD04_017570 [Chloroflexales bacterium ZM16-3]|nr:hypothetical protein [Chloroflexales bacterium ZM16-3]